MKHIFLSYSRKDLGFVERLAKDLQQAGYDVWYDLSDLEGGDRWAREIQAGIDQCDAFITVISPNSMASAWVEKEFLYASNAKKNIVPLMYVHSKLPIWLLDMHYIDIKGRNYKKNFPFILAAIEDTEQPIALPEPARGFSMLSPMWIGGIAGGVVLVLSTVFGLRALLTGSDRTPGGTLTTIPIASFSTFTPALVTEISIPSPTFTVEPATEVAVTPILAPAITDPKGVEMLLVPAGSFYMGSRQGSTSEEPIHVIGLDAFYIDKYEVTNAEYKNCVDNLVCDLPTNQRTYFDTRYNDHPVVYVNWVMADAYCKWRGARLPTEAEWEKTARGTELLEYPWGNQFDGKIVNYCDAYCSLDGKDKRYSDGYGNTSPVGSYEEGKSPYGVYDMAGNVREWVADLYSESYYTDSPKQNPPGPSLESFTDEEILRVLRGGSWVDNLNNVRAFTRDYSKPVEASSYVGFRCAVDAAP